MGNFLNDKFKTKDYKGAQDWAREFIDGQVLKHKKHNDKGEPVGKPEVDFESLVKLYEMNQFDVSKYRGGAYPNIGQARMSIGNSLRAAARKRHGLFNVDGEWVDADEDFIADHPLKENRDGSKIVKEKAEAEAEAA